MNETPADIDDIVAEFEFLGDWEERYRHIIELGKAMAPLNADERSDEARVKGCVSQVWLISEQDGANAVMTFRGDSDAHIVRGLVALLLQLYSGRSPEEILAIDANAFLARLSLDDHLSPSRSNGLRAMIDRIRAHAAQAQSERANP